MNVLVILLIYSTDECMGSLLISTLQLEVERTVAQGIHKQMLKRLHKEGPLLRRI